jgi:hypothetical protein
MELTHEQICMLAEVERKMDAGEMPFVLWHGNRAAMDKETMDHFRLTQGQTITDVIWKAILEFNIASCQDKIAERTVSDWMDREKLKPADDAA